MCHSLCSNCWYCCCDGGGGDDHDGDDASPADVPSLTNSILMTSLSLDNRSNRSNHRRCHCHRLSLSVLWSSTSTDSDHNCLSIACPDYYIYHSYRLLMMPSLLYRRLCCARHGCRLLAILIAVAAAATALVAVSHGAFASFSIRVHVEMSPILQSNCLALELSPHTFGLRCKLFGAAHFWHKCFFPSTSSCANRIHLSIVYGFLFVWFTFSIEWKWKEKKENKNKTKIKNKQNEQIQRKRNTFRNLFFSKKSTKLIAIFFHSYKKKKL